MRKYIILGCLGILFLVGIVSTTIFAVLYINSKNEIKVKNVELAACLAKPADTTTKCPDSTTTSTSTNLTFKDEGQSIEVVYPSTWVGTLNTKLSDDFAYEPEYGKVISKYEFDLKKGGATLRFSRILGGVDGFADGLKSSTHDWKVISGTDLIRVSQKGENDWKYTYTVDCSTLGDPFFTPAEVASFDICVGSFYPGFGVYGASTAVIKTGDATLLEEADEIAKSAMN